MGSNGGGSGASEAYIESSEPLLGKSGQQEEDISSQNYGPIGYNHGSRNAFGPSFGTVCFSGLIFGVVRIVRAAIDSARRGQEGIVFVILRCCVRFVLFAVEFVNKFTINFAAITGESYCSSARMSYELLRRNLLSAAVVEAISTRILYGILFVVTVVYAIVVCAILKAATSLGGDAYFVTVLAWVLLFLILLFFVHILDDVVDTVYICYAMDKDRRDLTRPEIHDVYSRLPVSRDDTSFPYSNAEV
uniref:Choline transporter-like protein n=1 Tax=Araucaria cunninghamii TaxID=56994 RepID=A0A0D6QX70_ARACU